MHKDKLMMRPLSKPPWRKELQLVKQREKILGLGLEQRRYSPLRLRQERKKQRVTNLMET